MRGTVTFLRAWSVRDPRLRGRATSDGSKQQIRPRHSVCRGWFSVSCQFGPRLPDADKRVAARDQRLGWQATAYCQRVKPAYGR